MMVIVDDANCVNILSNTQIFQLLNFCYDKSKQSVGLERIERMNYNVNLKHIISFKMLP